MTDCGGGGGWGRQDNTTTTSTQLESAEGGPEPNQSKMDYLGGNGWITSNDNSLVSSSATVGDGQHDHYSSQEGSGFAGDNTTKT